MCSQVPSDEELAEGATAGGASFAPSDCPGMNAGLRGHPVSETNSPIIAKASEVLAAERRDMGGIITASSGKWDIRGGIGRHFGAAR